MNVYNAYTLAKGCRFFAFYCSKAAYEIKIKFCAYYLLYTSASDVHHMLHIHFLICSHLLSPYHLLHQQLHLGLLVSLTCCPLPFFIKLLRSPVKRSVPYIDLTNPNDRSHVYCSLFGTNGNFYFTYFSNYHIIVFPSFHILQGYNAPWITRPLHKASSYCVWRCTLTLSLYLVRILSFIH